MNEAAEISVQGHGKVGAMPDSIVITLTVAAIKPDYPDALATLNERVIAINAALARAGAPESAVTTSYDIAEQWTNQHDSEKRKFHGYKASQTLKITIPLDKVLLGSVVTELAASNAKPGMRTEFIVRDTAAITQAARKHAVQQAKASALDLAAAAGLELREVKSIIYTGGGFRNFRNLEMDLDANVMCSFDVTPEVNPDVIDAEETVNMVWAAIPMN